MSARIRCFVPSAGGMVIFILFFFFHCSQSGRTAGGPGTGEKHLRARATTRPKFAWTNITRREGAAADVCVLRRTIIVSTIFPEVRQKRSYSVHACACAGKGNHNTKCHPVTSMGQYEFCSLTEQRPDSFLSIRREPSYCARSCLD